MWSYSRLKSFDMCPYGWYLKYICKLAGKGMFFASYGSFMHKLMEKYYNGEQTPKQLCDSYLIGFKNNVTGNAPDKKIFENYFKSGLQYLRKFQPLPYNKVGIEKRVKFNLEGISFIGYIDFLGEKDGELVIVNHKSRALKPKSNRSKPTKADEELDRYLTQLYLYSAAIEKEYGKLPRLLCFNCFRTPLLIEEQFSEQAYEKSKMWAVSKIKEISSETKFRPDIEYFKCTHLCEMQDYCEYYEIAKRER